MYRRYEVEKVTKLDFTFETREKMIRRDAKAEGRNETIEELAKYKAAFGDLNTTDAGAD